MTDHELRNVRRYSSDDYWSGDDPTCPVCHVRLCDVDLLDIVTRPGHSGPTFCDQECYDDWILDQPSIHTGKKVTDPDWMIPAPGFEKPRDAFAKATAPRSTPAYVPVKERPLTAKEKAQFTGLVAVHVVGFAIWLIVVSFVAAVLFAVTGINPFR